MPTFAITPYRREYLLERVTGASRQIIARFRTEDEAVQRLREIQSRETAEIRKALQAGIALRKTGGG